MCVICKKKPVLSARIDICGVKISTVFVFDNFSASSNYSRLDERRPGYARLTCVHKRLSSKFITENHAAQREGPGFRGFTP